MIRRIFHALLRRLAPYVSGIVPPAALMRLTTRRGHPNLNALWMATKDLEHLRLNVKVLAYELAHSMEHRLQAIPVDGPRIAPVESKPITQAEIETRWFRYWCEQLRERPRYHRTLGAYAYVLQALHEGQALRTGSRLLGVAAGQQPLPSYLARLGVKATVTGEAPRILEQFIDRQSFERQITPHPGDKLPEQGDYDGLWSIFQASRQGSIAQGLDFIERAMTLLKPGGTAVHVLEFNYADDSQTVDHWPAVLFQRRHIEALASRLEAQGHVLAPVSFHCGHQPLDRYVDVPPFDITRTPAFERLWRDGWESAHLKVSVDGFACAAFGLIVRRAA